MNKYIILIYVLTVGLLVATGNPIFKQSMINKTVRNKSMKLDISTKTYPNIFTYFDDEDYNKLKKYNWYPSWNKKTKSFYVHAGIYRKDKKQNDIITMQRIIMDNPVGKVVDHKDHDTLNNYKYNLRICTISENNLNLRPRKNCISKYKGVWKRKDIHRKKKWVAEIKYNKKRYHLGSFKTEIEAARAYNCAARIFFGEFAYLNEIIDA